MSAFHPKQTFENSVLQRAACAPHWPMSNRKYDPASSTRTRHDGWTNGRRVTFFVTLAATGSVTFAAASVGLSRKSAYALKKRDTTFASLWERALTMAGKARPAACPHRAEGNGNRVPIASATPSTGVNRAAAERDRFFAGLEKRLSGATSR